MNELASYPPALMAVAQRMPKQNTREHIDRMIWKVGWAAQDRGTLGFSAPRGVAVRESLLERGHGFAASHGAALKESAHA